MWPRNETSTVGMKFEFLSDEILIECFKYLNGIDLFYSFDQLNHRFYELIQTIPLHLDFRSVPKLKFVTFCTYLSSHPDIQQRVYSLQFSNEFYGDQIEKFLSWFSLIEFSHLQALSLVGVDEYDVAELRSILPRLPELASFRLIDLSQVGEELLSSVQITRLHRLEISQPLKNVKLVSEQTTITHLKLFSCNLYNLYKILKATPLLKSLNLQHVCREYPSHQRNSFQIAKLVYLKRMVLMEFEYSLEDLEFFVSHTPNLQDLTITNYGDAEIIDAIRWQRFITSSLPHLTNFHFLFSNCITEDIVRQFEQFQSAFWCKQHHWHTDYGFNEIGAVIHTIPYILNEYVLHSYPIQYQLDKSNRFKKVQKLSLYNGLNRDQHLHYFPKLTSLEWYRQSMREDDMANERDLKYLFRIVNFANLHHFSIFNNSSDDINWILLEIFKRAPRLTSLSFGCFNWKTLFQDKQLYLYLNRRIRVLNGQYYQLYMTDDVQQFCQVFSNLEQLKCQLCKREHLLYLLKNLPHLSVLKAIVFKSVHRKTLFRWLKKTAQLDVAFLVEERFSSDEREKVCIWLERNIDKTCV